jgi:hypothetical protein
MHIGRILACASSGTTTVFSEWMPRGADNGVFTLDLIQSFEGGALAVELFHKNSEESGAGTSAGTIQTSTSTTGIYAKTLSGLKELVRYQFTPKGNDATFGAVLYRMLPVTWFDTADAS